MLTPCSDLSLQDIESRVKQLLQSEDWGGAIDAVRDAVDSVINNPRSVARVYASRHLDSLCALIAEAIRCEPWAQPTDTPTKGTVVLATELAPAGGHVEVIKDVVRAKGVSEPAQLLLTNNFDRIQPDDQHTYAKKVALPLTIAQGGSTTERLKFLCEFLCRQRPDKLILLIHNQDALGIVAALACQVEHVLFVHHGDHHLSLGVTTPSFVHIDLSNHCFFLCRHQLGISNNVFWPLTLSNAAKLTRQGPFMAEGHLVTCSAGRREKFADERYKHQYFELVGLILAATKGRHIHIGPIQPADLLRIQEGLKAHGVAPDRFTHIPWAPSVAQVLVDNRVDVYLNSFPIGGPKSMIEATAAGVPVLVHKNYRSQFLSGIDFAHADVLTWTDPEELHSLLTRLDAATLAEQSQKNVQHFLHYYSEERFAQAVHGLHTDPASVPPLGCSLTDGLQAFLDEEAIAAATARAHFSTPPSPPPKPKSWLSQRASLVREAVRSLRSSLRLRA